MISKGLSGFLGLFFCFTAVSLTGSVVGIQTPLSDGMQTLFSSGVWGAIFMYTVGIIEFVLGFGMLGYVFDVTSLQLAQWCASIATFIMFNATAAHISSGDTSDKVAFSGAFCILFATLNFLIAKTRGNMPKGDYEDMDQDIA